MSVTHNNTIMKTGTHNSSAIKSWVHNGIEVFKAAVNKAITLITSVYSTSSEKWPYNANAAIYKNVDLSLYKGVQFYVDAAKIKCDFKGYNNNLYVVALPSGTTIYTEQGVDVTNAKGTIQIAYATRNAAGEETRTSQAGKTLTLNFTATSGTVDLAVIGRGSGSTSTGITWQLSNVILLAR